MCILFIKKSKNSDFAYFIGINRDEKYERKWKDINNHWPNHPSIFGYKDLESSGTWLAYNTKIIAFVINKEVDKYKDLNTRSYLALESLKYTTNTNDAITRLLLIDTSKIKPFNIVLVSRKNIKYATNYYNKQLLEKITYCEINEDVIMLNRSFPNDFNEYRVKFNFDKISSIDEPDPVNNNWKDWEMALQEECYAINAYEEKTLWINSKEWGTLISNIVAIPRNEELPFLIHTVKTRKL